MIISQGYCADSSVKCGGGEREEGGGGVTQKHGSKIEGAVTQEHGIRTRGWCDTSCFDSKRRETKVGGRGEVVNVWSKIERRGCTSAWP